MVPLDVQPHLNSHHAALPHLLVTAEDGASTG